MTEDIEWTGNDIVIAPDKDAATVEGRRRLEQSIGIHASEQLRRFIGQVISDQSITSITKSINNAVDEDENIDDVQSVRIIEIDRQNNTVTLEAQVTQANDSEIIVEL